MDGDQRTARSPLAKLRAFIISTVLISALSFVIAWPIWLYATSRSRSYTMTIAAFMVLLVAFAIARALRRRRDDRSKRRSA